MEETRVRTLVLSKSISYNGNPKNCIKASANVRVERSRALRVCLFVP